MSAYSDQIRKATEAKILAEASKPKGVTFHELRERKEISTSVSRDHCRRLASEGRLHCIKVKHGHGLRWFANKADAKAYGAAQAKLRASPNGIAEFKTAKVHIGSTPAFDDRYQCGPDFRGEFSKMQIGEYSTDAASCAARAKT